MNFHCAPPQRQETSGERDEDYVGGVAELPSSTISCPGRPEPVYFTSHDGPTDPPSIRIEHSSRPLHYRKRRLEAAYRPGPCYGRLPVLERELVST